MYLGFFALSLMIALILILAGRIDYWQGWAFGGITVILLLVKLIFFPSKGDLIKERIKPGSGTKWWDKIFYAFYIPAFFAIIIVGSLDGGRFGWTVRLPIFVYISGYIIYIFSISIFLWAQQINRFFSSVVRIQYDRGHEVIQTGPYQYVRHPGYIGGILMAISTALVLGSLWALIPAGIVAILLIIRTYLEDTMLQKELSGYAEYAKKVRYRLLPGIW
ncbi:Isoprenylcysteine carboxyl methyltransferase (ICMT) family protein [uncultured archaeon]|nr:Isoprenylcysteine carboxyl methyltransferase (ICMT) family protein [uncultured archaeon]